MSNWSLFPGSISSMANLRYPHFQTHTVWLLDWFYILYCKPFRSPPFFLEYCSFSTVLRVVVCHWQNAPEAPQFTSLCDGDSCVSKCQSPSFHCRVTRDHALGQDADGMTEKNHLNTRKTLPQVRGIDAPFSSGLGWPRRGYTRIRYQQIPRTSMHCNSNFQAGTIWNTHEHPLIAFNFPGKVWVFSIVSYSMMLVLRRMQYFCGVLWLHDSDHSGHKP